MKRYRILPVILVLWLAACSGSTPQPVSSAPTVTAIPVQVEQRGTLTYNVPVNDTLPNQTIHHWTFSAQAGDEVQVRLESDEWLPLLSVNGPDGQRTGRSPLMWEAAAGTYTIDIAERYGGGPYTLVVELLNPSPTPPPTATAIATATRVPTATATPIPTAADEPVLGTGDVQVTLRWQTGADLDLHVVDPFGDELAFYSLTSPSGGELDVDVIPCSRPNLAQVENVFWPPGDSPTGTYEVRVHYHPMCGEQGATAYEVTVRIDGMADQVFTGTLNQTNDWSETITFTR